MITLLVFLLGVALPLLLFAVIFTALPLGRHCPQCGCETVLLRSRLLYPVRRLLEWRWCLACGWDGITRTGRLRPLRWQRAMVREDTQDAERDAPRRG